MKNKVMVVFLAFSLLCFFVFFGFVASADDTSAFDESTKEVYESFSFQNVISLLYNSVKQAFFRSIPVFSGLVGMIFVSSVINALGLCFERFDVGEYVCSLCFSGFLFSVILILVSIDLHIAGTIRIMVGSKISIFLYSSLKLPLRQRQPPSYRVFSTSQA